MATKKVLKTEAESQADLLESLKRVADEQSIPVEALIATIEGAIASAYKKAFGGTGAVRVVADFEKSDFRVFAQKLVVQTVLNTNTEIAWRDARADNPGLNLGDAIEREVTPQGFGRIAAQTAKQVLLQRLREAVRHQVVSEYSDRAGQMFRGIVQRSERGDIVLSIGKAEAILPRREQIPTEHYRTGDSIYVYVIEVRQNFRGPSIRVSRTHPGLVNQLFQLEVPEIADEIVELKAVAREAGQRTKIAVAASNPDVDPVGACVGPRGMRVGKVVAELGNEKVDIVRWNADPIAYLSNALSPAQISKVILVEQEGSDSAGTATVIVAEDQQSLAIGKQGQNVRLAAKLTGWRIDIRTEKQYAEEQAKKMFDVRGADAPAVTVRESRDEHAELFAVDENGGSETHGENAPIGEATDLSVLMQDETPPAPEGTENLFPVETETESIRPSADGHPENGRTFETDDAPDAVDLGSAAPPEDITLPGEELAETEARDESIAPADSVQA